MENWIRENWLGAAGEALRQGLLQVMQILGPTGSTTVFLLGALLASISLDWASKKKG